MLSKPTVEEVQRRRALRSWIPSGVIALILLTVIIVGLVLRSQGLGQPRTQPPAVGAHGYSKFDDEGLSYISDTRNVWLDLRNEPMLAAPLKLPANGTTNIFSRNQVYNFLGLYGNETSIKLPIDSLTITTAGGQVAVIDALVVNDGDFSDARAGLEAASGYGLDPSETDAFITQALRDNRAGNSYSRTLGPGTALGVPITVTVSCAAANSCVEHYVVRPVSG